MDSKLVTNPELRLDGGAVVPKRVSILILEPDEQAAREYAEAFSRRGWVVYRARTFMEALELEPKHYYHVMMIEVMLPDIAGTDAWNYLHKLSPDASGIITTSSHSLHSSVNASDPGIISYLLKPFDLDLVSDLIVQAIERRQFAAQNGRLGIRLSALGTLLSYAMHAPPDLAIAAALTQLPTILKPDWVGIYRLNQDKSWTPYWEPDHSSIHPEWIRVNFEFLKQWMAEAIESLQPVVIGVPGGSESTVGSAHRSGGSLGCCVVVPLVGYVQTYGALVAASGSDSDHDIAPTEVQLIKVAGQAIALALDRSLGANSPVEIGVRDKARTAASQLVREEVQV